MLGNEMEKETISLKTDGRGRVTIPSRLRDKCDVTDEDYSWWRITIEGLDPDQHPDKSDLNDGDNEVTA
jgi:hypothetical protein